MICILLFIVCNIINLPIFFVVSPRKESDYDEILNDLDKLSTFTYCSREPFFFSQTGRLIIYFNVICRDGLTLFIEITLSVYSLILFRKYLNKQSNQINSISLTQLENNLNQVIDENKNNKQLNSSRLINKMESFNRDLTKMTLCLSLCSIVSHFGTACCYILVSLDDKRNLIITTLIFFTFLLFNIKFFSNFYLFYYFNLNFKAFIKCKS